jgi:hypothetical protein
MLRANAMPGHLSNKSEAISVARFHCVPPIPLGCGDADNGSKAIISNAVDCETNGRTTEAI